MQLLDVTLPTPEENLALDEALLDEVESTGAAGETLRLWEPAEPCVVIGRSSQRAQEVNLEYCRTQGIKVLRRASGGAAIVAGPGCLMYAVLLSYDERPVIRAVDAAHRFVLDTIRHALSTLTPSVERRGTSDLAIGERKFSGNSLRCKRRGLLYHGTLLYDFDLGLIPASLRTAPRQPDYRAGRTHEQFVTNLSMTAAQLRAALVAAWEAQLPRTTWNRALVQSLVNERFAREDWNGQR